MTGGEGMKNFKIDMRWKYSDDTVMHLATVRALLTYKDKPDLKFYQKLATEYVGTIKLMGGRSPGKTCMK